MDSQIIEHRNIGQRYRLVIERAASTKGVNGYKLEVNSDCLETIGKEMEALKAEAERLAEVTGLAIAEKGG